MIVIVISVNRILKQFQANIVVIYVNVKTVKSNVQTGVKKGCTNINKSVIIFVLILHIKWAMDFAIIVHKVVISV